MASRITTSNERRPPKVRRANDTTNTSALSSSPSTSSSLSTASRLNDAPDLRAAGFFSFQPLPSFLSLLGSIADTAPPGTPTLAISILTSQELDSVKLSSATDVPTDSVAPLVSSHLPSTPSVIVTLATPTSTSTVIETTVSVATAQTTTVLSSTSPINRPTPATASTSPDSVAPSSSELRGSPPGVFVPLSGSAPAPTLQIHSIEVVSSDVQASLLQSTLPSQSESVAATVLAPAVLDPSRSLAAADPSKTTDGSPVLNDSSTDHTAASNKGGVDTKTVVAASAGAIGGLLLLLFVAALAVLCLRRRRRQRSLASFTDAQAAKPGTSFGQALSRCRISSGLKSLVSKPLTMTARATARFHSRGQSSAGLMSEYNQNTALNGRQSIYRFRRSKSEPQQSFAVIPRPAGPISGQQSPFSPKSQQRSSGRPGTVMSAGPMQVYQMPWQESPCHTPVPKILRVVNGNTADNTPTFAHTDASPGHGPRRNSYFGLQYPAKSVAPVAPTSHRRSVSSSCTTVEDPFFDRRVSRASISRNTSSITSSKSGGHHVRNFSRLHLRDPAPAARQSDQHSRGSREPESAIYRSTSAMSGRTDSRQSADDASVAYGLYYAATRHNSSESYVTNSTDDSLSKISFSNENTPGMSPITETTTVSRNASNASKFDVVDPEDCLGSDATQMRCAAYEENYKHDLRNSSKPTTQVVERNEPLASRRTSSSDSETSSLHSDATLNSDEHGHRHPASHQLTLRPPLSRQTSALSNDPFDLDRPEVLGYTPGAMKTRFDQVNRSEGVERSDSAASRGSVAGRRSRRRSSFQEWHYMHT